MEATANVGCAHRTGGIRQESKPGDSSSAWGIQGSGNEMENHCPGGCLHRQQHTERCQKCQGTSLTGPEHQQGWEKASENNSAAPRAARANRETAIMSFLSAICKPEAMTDIPGSCRAASIPRVAPPACRAPRAPQSSPSPCCAEQRTAQPLLIPPLSPFCFSLRKTWKNNSQKQCRLLDPH